MSSFQIKALSRVIMELTRSDEIERKLCAAALTYFRKHGPNCHLFAREQRLFYS